MDGLPGAEPEDRNADRDQKDRKVSQAPPPPHELSGRGGASIWRRFPDRAPLVEFAYPRGFPAQRVEAEQIRAEIEFNKAAVGADSSDLKGLHFSRILRIFRVFVDEACAFARAQKVLDIVRFRKLGESFLKTYARAASLDRGEDIAELKESNEWTDWERPEFR